MKGMLIKDLKLMKVQKNFFIVVIFMAVALSFAMGNLSFIMGYLTFVIPMFTVSSISYDEFDYGYPFLFTLPISRKGYVAEKYVFSFILGFGSFVVSLALILSVGLFVDYGPIGETLRAIPFILAVMAVLMSVMIPLQLKFGAEKSRIALILTGGVLFVIGYGISKISEYFEIDLIGKIMSVNFGILVVIAVLTAGIILFLSLKISQRIMAKKEF